MAITINHMWICENAAEMNGKAAGSALFDAPDEISKYFPSNFRINKCARLRGAAESAASEVSHDKFYRCIVETLPFGRKSREFDALHTKLKHLFG